MLESQTHSEDNLNFSENHSSSVQKVQKTQVVCLHRPQERALMLDRIFREYLEAKSQSGELFPIEISHLGYAPNREEICNEIQARFGIYVEPGNYLYSGWFSDKVKQLCLIQLQKQGKTKPSLKEKQAARTEEVLRQKKYAEVLESWLKQLKESGGKLKFNNYAGGTDNAWISEQTGIPYAHLVKTLTSCYRLVKKARKEIGLENFQTSEKFVLKQHTYQDLLDYGTDSRKAELEIGNNSQAQVNNTRHALRKFIKVTNLALESQIGDEFGTLFSEALQKVAETITNSTTRKKSLRELRRWQEYYSGLLQTDSLPPDFPSALKFLIEMSGRTFSELNRLYCLKKVADGQIVRSWANGATRPSLKYLPLIHKIEDFFHLERNTLSGRISFSTQSGRTAALRKGKFPRLNHGQKAKVVKYLPPNFPLLPERNQKLIVDEIVENVLQKSNVYRQRISALIQAPYRLHERNFSDDLINEIERLREFKTSPVPIAGYKRGIKAKWGNDPEKRGTVKVFTGILECLFGILTLPVEGGGFNVQLSQLTLTLIILPKTWRAYLEFGENRYGAIPASTAFRSLSMLHSFIHPETGWITQSPWLADKLAVIPGLLSEQDIKKAKSNWQEFLGICNAELDEIYQAIKILHNEASYIRDSHLPILPILENDNPLVLLRNAVEAYEENVASQHIAPMRNANSFRNVIFLRILIETGLRASNMIGMTWKDDNTGHLRRGEDGHFYLRIPHTEFKNSNSSYFGPPGRKNPYQVQLSKALTPWLNEYLPRCRPYLIERHSVSKRGTGKSADEGFLFVSTPAGKTQRISYQAASKIVNDFSKIHLVYNPITKTGIKGVESFGLHSVRHIIATHVLKKTGSFADAGAAIQDSEISAQRYYARYLPTDRDKRIRHVIAGLMEADRE